jgi:hypothetical protein
LPEFAQAREEAAAAPVRLVNNGKRPRNISQHTQKPGPKARLSHNIFHPASNSASLFRLCI